MKRVLHINCNYMGTKLHQTMIEHFEKYDIDNVVFCPIYGGSEIVTTPHDNVTVSKCFSFYDRLFFFRKQKKILKEIKRSYNPINFSCIHAYTLFTDGNCAYNISREYRIPYVVAIRATDLVFFKYRPYLKKRGTDILNSAAAIFFLSKATMKKVYNGYLKGYNTSNLLNKSYIIPNGIDDYWHERKPCIKKCLPNKEQPIEIICVAKIIKRKNIPVLQRAIQLLNSHNLNVKLTLIGEGVNKKELALILKDNNTTYFQPVTKEKLIDYYRKATIFVLPSKGETFGLVYAEAISQGLPVLYSANEGFDEQFEEGVVGYHVNPNSSKDIAKKIVRIVKEYPQISERIMDCSAKYKWDDIVAEYVRIYERL